MSWFNDHLGIRFDRHTLGNLLKNAAPVAGTVVGGPLGLAIGGLGGAAGEAALPGSNFGDILKSGVSGAGMTGLGEAAKTGLSGLLSSGGGGGGGTSGGGGMLPGGPPPSNALDDLASGALPKVSQIGATPAVAGPSSVPSLAPSLDSTFQHFGSSPAEKPGLFSDEGWLAKHSNAVGMGLKGLGEAANAPSQNAYRRAQTNALQVDTQAAEDERRRRIAMQSALDPIRQALAGQLNQPQSPVAANPYLPLAHA